MELGDPFFEWPINKWVTNWGYFTTISVEYLEDGTPLSKWLVKGVNQGIYNKTNLTAITYDLPATLRDGSKGS